MRFLACVHQEHVYVCYGLNSDSAAREDANAKEHAVARAQLKHERNEYRRALEQRLQRLLAVYPGVCLRRRWAALFQWYLSAQPFHQITTINALQGIHYYPVVRSLLRFRLP
jgi:hypothetical protein